MTTAKKAPGRKTEATNKTVATEQRAPDQDTAEPSPRFLRYDRTKVPFVVCGRCQRVRGGPIGTVGAVTVWQLCACSSTEEHRAQPRVGDHNTAAELCRCCGLELLDSGSKWSVWFCRTCLDRIRKMNLDAGRCLVPIGRHSLMNGVFRGRPKAKHRVVAFANELQALFNRIGGTESWAGRAVRMNLARAGLDAEVDHDVRVYLGAFSEVESLKEQRFQEMIEHASSAGVKPTGVSV